MSNLSAAIDHFNQAFGKLETALQTPKKAEENVTLQGNVARLRSQRERLMSELEQLRSQREIDVNTQEATAERLDGIIGELRHVLGKQS